MNTVVLLSCILVAGGRAASAFKYDQEDLYMILNQEGFGTPKQLTTDESREAESFTALHFHSRIQPNSEQDVTVPEVVKFFFTCELSTGALFEVLDKFNNQGLKKLTDLHRYSDPTFREVGNLQQFKRKADDGLRKYLQALKIKYPKIVATSAQANTTPVKITGPETQEGKTTGGSDETMAGGSGVKEAGVDVDKWYVRTVLSGTFTIE